MIKIIINSLNDFKPILYLILFRKASVNIFDSSNQKLALCLLESQLSLGESWGMANDGEWRTVQYLVVGVKVILICFQPRMLITSKGKTNKQNQKPLTKWNSHIIHFFGIFTQIFCCCCCCCCCCCWEKRSILSNTVNNETKFSQSSKSWNFCTWIFAIIDSTSFKR